MEWDGWKWINESKASLAHMELEYGSWITRPSDGVGVVLYELMGTEMGWKERIRIA